MNALCSPMHAANACYNPYPHLNCGWFHRYSDDPRTCEPASKYITAGAVRVGDWVEFEPGERTRVVAIEETFGPHDGAHDEVDPSSPGFLKRWGRSLTFQTSLSEDDDTFAQKSFYIRRDKSPCLSDPFGRSGTVVHVVR